MMVKHENPGSGVGQIKRIQSQRTALASYTGVASAKQSSVIRHAGLEELRKYKPAEAFDFEIPFPVRVAGGETPDGGMARFLLSAQLDGGGRFEAFVNRPKGTDGRPIELVSRGDYGYATVRTSRNNGFDEDVVTGKLTLLAKPTLVGWRTAPDPFSIRAHMGPNGTVIWDAPADAPADAPKVQPKKNLGLG